MTKNIAILILILLLILTGFLFLLRENINYDEKLRLVEAYQISQIKYLGNISLLSANYNELESKYQELYQKSKDKEAYINMAVYKGEFIATAYTSDECGYITKIGMDLRGNYSRYFNIAAVDPDIIPLGSIFLAEIDKKIYVFFAADIGEAIKGKEIDIYLRIPQSEAIKFGRQKVRIWILENNKFIWS